jgi:hypothetical protein
MKKSGLVRMEVSLEVDNLVAFYYLSTSEIWADKQRETTVVIFTLPECLNREQFALINWNSHLPKI